MTFFDSHCHLDSFRAIAIPEEIRAITSGYSHESNLKNAQIAKEHKGVYCTLGIAPQTAIRAAALERDLPMWLDFIRSQKPVAIGEIGLDFHWGKTEEDFRKERAVFDASLSLAREMNLPVVIHSRKSDKEVLDFLQEKWKRPFVMHCFSGTLEDAKRVLDMGGLISIPPIRSKERKKAIRHAPLESLLIETDAPYIGKTLEDVKISASIISEAREIPLGKVEEITYENTARFFKVE